MAVYTHVPDKEMAQFIASYGLGELMSCKGIAEGVENTNYLIKTAKGPFILTLYEKRVNLEELPFFLELMEHLARAGIACPTPVRDLEGRNLRKLAGRPAAIITFLDGLSVRWPDVSQCEAVGVALANLHLAGADFAMQRRNGLGIDGWRPLFERFANQADEITPGMRDIIEGELVALDAGWPAARDGSGVQWNEGIETGVIHADLFPDNVFFRGHHLSGIIDFYFGCNDAFAYDVAVCLNAWCFDRDTKFDIDRGAALLRGYQSLRPLTGAERDALVVLSRGAALRFLLTRCYDWINTSPDALVSPKDPADYLARLRFHQSISSPRDYGLDDG